MFSRNATKLQDYERKLSPHSKDSLDIKMNPRTVKILITEPRFIRNIPFKYIDVNNQIHPQQTYLVITVIP